MSGNLKEPLQSTCRVLNLTATFETENSEASAQLPFKYRVFSFKFGELKQVDQNILSFLSCRDGLSSRTLNKYFNKLIGDNMIDYFIFESIINSLKIIPQRARNIKTKIQHENEYDQDNGSHIFIDRCIKNEMFDQFLAIVEKNEFFKQSKILLSKASVHKSEIACQLIKRLNKKCKQIFGIF